MSTCISNTLLQRRTASRQMSRRRELSPLHLSNLPVDSGTVDHRNEHHTHRQFSGFLVCNELRSVREDPTADKQREKLSLPKRVL